MNTDKAMQGVRFYGRGVQLIAQATPNPTPTPNLNPGPSPTPSPSPNPNLHPSPNPNPNFNPNPNPNPQDVQLAGNMLGRAVLQGYTLRAREVKLSVSQG